MKRHDAAGANAKPPKPRSPADGADARGEQVAAEIRAIVAERENTLHSGSSPTSEQIEVKPGGAGVGTPRDAEPKDLALVYHWLRGAPGHQVSGHRAGPVARAPMSNTPENGGPPTAKKRTDREDRKRVLLWIEAARAYGRGCLLGIAGYARDHANWRVFYFEHHIGEDMPPFFSELKVDGVISRTDNQLAADHLAELGVPVVDLRGAVVTRMGRTMDTDHVGCAQLAFDHFWHRGFRSMGYCGYPGVDWSIRRREAFVEVCAKAGIEAPVYMGNSSLTLQETYRNEALGEKDDPGLEQWLLSLPKPIAIFAANDVRGRQVVSACANAGIAVPEQVAVLGVDDDEVLCELSDPPLSSIEPDTYRMGYQGAALLESFMNDPSLIEPRPVELVPPKRVVARQSTDVAAIADEVVAACIRLIRERGGKGVTVADLSDETGLSRTTLERRFRDAIDRSPKQEINRVRLDRARRLVRDTDYPLHQIAEIAGYSNASRLLVAYRRHFGITPGLDREQTSLASRTAELVGRQGAAAGQDAE